MKYYDEQKYWHQLTFLVKFCKNYGALFNLFRKSNEKFMEFKRRR